MGITYRDFFFLHTFGWLKKNCCWSNVLIVMNKWTFGGWHQIFFCVMLLNKNAKNLFHAHAHVKSSFSTNYALFLDKLCQFTNTLCYVDQFSMKSSSRVITYHQTSCLKLWYGFRGYIFESEEKTTLAVLNDEWKAKNAIHNT